MTTEELIWKFIFELFNVSSYDELREKLLERYKIIL
jgi:hypothetical protein